MDAMDMKRRIALIAVPFSFLVLMLSTVDLSRWLNPTSENDNFGIRVSASASPREFLVPPLVFDQGQFDTKGGRILDPSLVEGYTEPDHPPVEGIHSVTVPHPFSVLIGSYKNARNAEQVMAACREKGYLTYTTETELGSRGSYIRVFAGCFTHLEDALDFIRSEHLENAVPMKTRYANFIGSFPSPDGVQHAVRRLSDSGYSPYFIEDGNGGYRLYAGAFETRKAAEKEAARLENSGFSCRPVKR